jgi:hypothetical protein
MCAAQSSHHKRPSFPLLCRVPPLCPSPQERYRSALAAANLPTDLEGAENPARRRSSIGIPSLAQAGAAPSRSSGGGSRAASVELEPSAAKVCVCVGGGLAHY